jgi:hypothetical protein
VIATDIEIFGMKIPNALPGVSPEPEAWPSPPRWAENHREKGHFMGCLAYLRELAEPEVLGALQEERSRGWFPLT